MKGCRSGWFHARNVKNMKIYRHRLWLWRLGPPTASPHRTSPRRQLADSCNGHTDLYKAIRAQRSATSDYRLIHQQSIFTWFSAGTMFSPMQNFKTQDPSKPCTTATNQGLDRKIASLQADQRMTDQPSTPHHHGFGTMHPKSVTGVRTTMGEDLHPLQARAFGLQTTSSS